MPQSARNAIGLTGLAAAAVLSWFWGRPGPIEQATPRRSDDSLLGYYLRDAAMLGMDDDGHLLYRVWARQIEERPDESRLLMREVRIQYQPIADIPWQLTAAHGEAPADRSYLDLSGHVQLARDAEGGGDPTVIQAEQLRLEPDSFLASTAGNVSVSFGGRRLDAVGLKADLKEDRLELESNVHGQFDP